jgi:hypothetical protein
VVANHDGSPVPRQVLGPDDPVRHAHERCAPRHHPRRKTGEGKRNILRTGALTIELEDRKKNSFT